MRLFDEIFDWIIKNGRWLSFQRIKTFARQYDSNEINRTLQAFSRSVYNATRNVRLKIFLNFADIKDESPFDSDRNLIFKLRALFSISPRAEILAYLLCNERVSASEIIGSTGYSKPAVYDTLNDLVIGKYIDQYNMNGSMKYFVDFNRWNHFLKMDKVLPVWIDWQRVFVAIYSFSFFLIENAFDIFPDTPIQF